MKLCPSNNSCVAWFKLAECVNRGEKERALNMFNLLMHSVKDKALGFQLQGDMLSAFDDPQALECYYHAAEMYIFNQQFIQAIGAYEQALLIDQSEKTIEKLLEAYKFAESKNRLEYFLQSLIMNIIHYQQFKQGEYILEKLNHAIDRKLYIKSVRMLRFAQVKANYSNKSTSFNIVKSTVELLSAKTHSLQLNIFLTELKSFDKEFYTEALNFLKK